MNVLEALSKVGAIERDTEVIDGVTFHVRSLSGEQRAQLQKIVQETGQMPEYVTVAYGLVNEKGEPEAPVELMIEKLKAVKGSLVSQLCSAVVRVSKLQKEAIDDAEKK